jgi:SMI1/KNR4 family protein SUKH-1
MLDSNLPAIESVEARLARKLPSAFRDFLLRSNGGEIELLELPWEVTPVEEIIPITDEARKWPSFPPGGVSVGDDGCGNHLVFLPSAQDTDSFAPSLYVWWHEGGELEMVGADFNAAISGG